MVAGSKKWHGVSEDNPYKCRHSQLCNLNGSFVDLIKETNFNWAAVKSLKYKSWHI